MISILNPDPEDFILSEIAVGLSRETRWGGAATRISWSVAQHLLLCDRFAVADGHSSPGVLLAIILHDAPEYMLRDMIAPVKGELQEYKALETIWWRAMAIRFDIPETMGSFVKHYDRIAGSSEKAALISEAAGVWPWDVPAREIDADLLSLSETRAARMFVHRVLELLALRDISVRTT